MIPEMQFGPVTPLVMGMWVVALLSLMLMPVVWHYRKRTGGRGLILLLISMFVWNIFSSLEYLSISLDSRYFWMQLSCIGLCLAPGTGILIGRIFCGDDQPLPRWAAIVMSVIPATTLLLVFTNQHHGLIWQSFSIDPISGANVLSYGYWFYIWLAYAYFAFLTLMFLTGRAVVMQRGTFRWQAIGMAIAALPPWIANIIYLYFVTARSEPRNDLTPLALGLTGILLALNRWIFHFLEHVPVARTQILDSMDQGVLVLDEKYVILDANPVMGGILQADRSAIIGKNLLRDFPTIRTYLPAILGAEGERYHELYVEGIGYVNLHISPMRRRGVAQPGWVVLVDDISERKLAEQALLNAHNELQAKLLDLERARNTIETLGELIPICAWCGRRIQQEDGTWIEVDQFIEQHSHSAMTHGICPECAGKL